MEIQQKRSAVEWSVPLLLRGQLIVYKACTHACKWYAVKSSNKNQLQIYALLSVVFEKDILAFSADFVPGDYVTNYQIDPYC